MQVESHSPDGTHDHPLPDLLLSHEPIRREVFTLRDGVYFDIAQRRSDANAFR
jgi:hypothetical protein